jgi:hypothetical protein
MKDWWRFVDDWPGRTGDASDLLGAAIRLESEKLEKGHEGKNGK